METFVYTTIKIFAWLIVGGIVKFIFTKQNITWLSNLISKKFSFLLVFVIIPFFTSILIWKLGLNKDDSILILIAFMLILLFGLFASKKISSKTGYSFKEIFFPITFMNTLYLGLPITEYFVSRNAVYYTIIYSIIATLLQFTLGIALISPKYISALLTSPIIYSSIIGFILNKTSIPIPNFISTIHNFLFSIISPMTLFFMGYSLPWEKIFHNKRLHITISLFIRTFSGLVISLLYCVIVKIFFLPDISQELIKTIVLISGLPSAVINYIILEEFNIDTSFTTGEIIWGTFLIIFLLPYISELLDLVILILF